MLQQAEEIIELLGLKELPEEGGYYRRTYQAEEKITFDHSERAIGDSIYYLITEDQFSHLHKLKGDEMWHFYAGDPVEMVLFDDDCFKLIEIGNLDFSKHFPQQLVKANQWQGTKLKPGGKWALLGTNAFPGYDHSDFTLGKLEMFKNRSPEQREIIRGFVS
jgi:predicted cupin superfamily sugar epimerase